MLIELRVKAYHLIVEFYASGNIILTDYNYRILSLLRLVTLQTGTDAPASTLESEQKQSKEKQSAKQRKEDETENIRIAVGEIYDEAWSRTFTPITEERLIHVLKSDDSVDEATGNGVPKKHKKKKDSNNLKKLLKDQLGPDYGPALIEHVLSLDPSLLSKTDDFKSLKDDLMDSQSHTFQKVLKALQQADKIISSCRTEIQKGWILAKSYDNSDGKTSGSSESVASSTTESKEFLEFIDFNPYELMSIQPGMKQIPHDTFNKAVDVYFSSIEAQKLEARARQAEANAKKKLESVKAGHSAQIQGLANLLEKSEANARAIESNLDQVEALLRTLRGFLASGMDWLDLSELIKDESRRGNPLAQMVVELKLQFSLVTVRLHNPVIESEEDSDAEDDDDSEEENSDKEVEEKKFDLKKSAKDSFLKIDLDVFASAHANARKYYESKKSAAVKQEKTTIAAEKALKTTVQKIESDLKATTSSVPTGIIKIRKPFWFEKFLWFISSENYLVIGGKDAGQNEVNLFILQYDWYFVVISRTIM